MSVNLDNEYLPVAPLKIIAMDNCTALGQNVDTLISKKRKETHGSNNVLSSLSDYILDSYMANYHMDMLYTGERQAVIEESVRGTDLFIICDVANRSTLYDNSGTSFSKSPDEHFQDLKRVISACHGSTNRINVIMPYLYQGRFNNRKNLESLDCANALQDLINMGISNIITFDAHEPRIQNAIPIQGIDNFPTSYHFLEAIINGNEGLIFNKDNLIIASPDLGGMGKVVFYSSIIGVDMGMFYIRKDYSKKLNGENPVVGIEFLGGDINGKDVIIVDDIIDSGNTIIKTAKEIKKRGAGKVIIAATYGLFTNGLEIFDEAYNDGLFNRIYTTNLTYVTDELRSKPYYRTVDMSKQLAELIMAFNIDCPFRNLTDHSGLIRSLLGKE